MLISGVFAIVFGVLNSRIEESVVGLTALVGLGGVVLAVMMRRPNPLKAALKHLPEDPDERIAVLEEGLARKPV